MIEQEDDWAVDLAPLACCPRFDGDPCAPGCRCVPCDVESGVLTWAEVNSWLDWHDAQEASHAHGLPDALHHVWRLGTRDRAGGGPDVETPRARGERVGAHHALSRSDRDC